MYWVDASAQISGGHQVISDAHYVDWMTDDGRRTRRSQGPGWGMLNISMLSQMRKNYSDQVRHSK